jgi:hypothetical protein
MHKQISMKNSLIVFEKQHTKRKLQNLYDQKVKDEEKRRKY